MPHDPSQPEGGDCINKNIRKLDEFQKELKIGATLDSSESMGFKIVFHYRADNLGSVDSQGIK